MKKELCFLTAIIILCFSFRSAHAQSEDVPRFEVGAQFTTLTKPDFDGGRTEAGFGGRFTYNLTDYLALEAEGNFFPHRCLTCTSGNNGRITEGLFGIKAGRRFNKFGLFAKARPGFVRFGEGVADFIPLPSPPGPFPLFEIRRRPTTNFAVDVGGVLEFYPSRRIVTRFDAGDTIIRYGPQTFSTFAFDPTTGATTVDTFTTPSETRHNFQFSAGVGFRF